MTNKYLEKVASTPDRRKAFGLKPKPRTTPGLPMVQEVAGAAKIHPMPKPPGRFANLLHHPGTKAGAAVGALAGAAYLYGKRNGQTKTENKYLQKAAKFLDPENQKDLADTATIGLMGGLTATATDMIVHKHLNFNPMHFAVGTGLGLAGDYAALRANKHINQHIDKVNAP